MTSPLAFPGQAAYPNAIELQPIAIVLCIHFFSLIRTRFTSQVQNKLYNDTLNRSFFSCTTAEWLATIFSSSLSSSASSWANSGQDDDESNKSDNVHTLPSKPLILVKIWCLVLVFVGTFGARTSLYFFKWNEGILVLRTQFAGPVLCSFTS